MNFVYWYYWEIERRESLKCFTPLRIEIWTFPPLLLRHSKAVTREKWRLPLLCWDIQRRSPGEGGRITSSNFCIARRKTYSKSPFSWSLNNKRSYCEAEVWDPQRVLVPYIAQDQLKILVRMWALPWSRWWCSCHKCTPVRTNIHSAKFRATVVFQQLLGLNWL